MDERNWTDRPLQIGDEIRIGPVRVVHKSLGFAALLSGNLDAAVKALAPDAPMIGLNGEVGEQDFVLRIGRDRALLVSNDQIVEETGWNCDGYAFSAADDCYCLLEISGDRDDYFLAQGTSCHLGNSSPSAAIMFAGVNSLLARKRAVRCLFVDRAHLTYVSSWLRGAASPDPPPLK